jgi:TonB-dependent receptor
MGGGMLNKSFTFFGRYLVLFFFLSQSVFAQGNSRIQGKVTDASTKEALPGANIILVGSSWGASSDRFGAYTINNVAVGKYTLKVSYIGYHEFSTSVNITQANQVVNVNASLQLSAIKINEVVVNGLLQGQVKALNQQFNSDNIKNVLSQEEMQKFPDMNTAETLQRIPGVTIDRSLGEGSFVYVRGTEPRLTQVTVDGQAIPSSQEDARYIDLGIINSSQLASIEVTKTLTPDMDANAIGGTVNLVTRSPFDQEKSTVKLDVGGGYAPQGKSPLYRASGVYTGFMGKDQQFGYTISGSYYRNNIRTYSNEYDWGNVNDINGNVIPFALNDLRFYDYNTRRDHYGASGDFEYRSPDKTSTFYVRGMYNRLNDEQSRNMVRNRISSGDYINATTIAKTKLAFEFQNRDEIHDIVSVSGGGKHNFSNLSLDYDLTYGWANQTQTGAGSGIKSEWALNTKPNMILDLSNVNFPGITYTNISNNYELNPANWEIDNQDLRDVTTTANNLVGNLNLKFPYSIGTLPGNIKLGAKVTVDKKDRVGNRSRYKWKGDNTVLMSAVSSNETVNNFLLGHYTFGPEVDNGRVRTFYDQYLGQDNALRQYVNYTDADGSGGDYHTRENIYAGYAMGTLNIGDMLVLAGLRDEFTSTNYHGTQIFLDNNGDFLSSAPIDNTHNYNNVFPYLQLRYKLTDKSNMRFAVTRSIARPNFFDLAPYNWVDPKSDQITRGNPELVPTIATNVDLMYGHYFQGIGVISAGLFYKAMDQVIYQRTYKQVGGQYDGFDINEPVNGGSADLYGLELNWQQQFTFLPGVFSAFGIYGNYTYTKSKAKLQYRDWSVLPGQAGDVGNVGLSFERFGITARLSMNYNAKVLTEVGKSPDYDRYNDNHWQLDFSGNYVIMKNLSFYIDIINLTNQPAREFQGISSRPRSNEYYGFTMRSGLKINL